MIVQLHGPTTLPKEKNPRYTLYGKLGVLQSQSGHFGENNLTDFNITGNSVALWDQGYISSLII
jgi:hypothetical protein